MSPTNNPLMPAGEPFGGASAERSPAVAMATSSVSTPRSAR